MKPLENLDVVVGPRSGYSVVDFDQHLRATSLRLVRPNSRITMMPPRKANPRAEYRLSETLRVNSSVSLAEKFPKLKSLKVDLLYFDADGTTKTGELRYKVNVQHAKWVFPLSAEAANAWRATLI